MSEPTEKPKKKRSLHATTLHVLTAALVCSLAGIVLTFSAAWAKRQEHIEAEASTDVFQTFELPTLDGGTFSAAELRATTLTAVNVWGTDCPPCIHELPDLEKINSTYAESEFRIIGVPMDVSDQGKEINEYRLAEAHRIVEAAGVTFVNVIPDEKMFTFLSGTMLGTPTTFFLDNEGKIVETVTGSRTKEDWEAIVTELLHGGEQE